MSSKKKVVDVNQQNEKKTNKKKYKSNSVEETHQKTSSAQQKQGERMKNPKGGGGKQQTGKTTTAKKSINTAKQEKKPLCKFHRDGHCRKGSKCNFSHDKPSKKHTVDAKGAVKGKQHSSVTMPQKLQKFYQSLKSAKSDVCFLPSPENLQNWRECFTFANDDKPGLEECRTVLCQTYLKLPDDDRYAPSAAAVLKIIHLHLKSSEVNIDLMCSVFEDRLLRDSSLRSVEKVSVRKVLCELTDSLLALRKDCPEELLDQVLLLSCLKKKYDDKLSKIGPSSVISPLNEKVEPDNSFTRWLQKPTIDWLASGCIVGGPVLKVKYESVEEYVTTLQSVWTLLTFYWGMAALWPRCKFHFQGEQNKSCGKPLLTKCKQSRGQQCSMKIRKDGKVASCPNTATWSCCHRGHDCICSICLKKQKELITGSEASRECSTDLYDGQVTRTRLRMDSMELKLSKVVSRRPPAVAVQWKTSYRLQPAALVGVVPVTAAKSSLEGDMQIFWGEIVTSNRDEPEHRARERQQMTIRILSRTDCEQLPSQMDLPFATDSTVVVIDMRVFVPEVISVLSTLTSTSFHDGFKGLSFSMALISRPSEDDNIKEIQHCNVETLHNEVLSAKEIQHCNVETLHNEVLSALEGSDIRCIKQLGHDERDKIARKICAVSRVRTLDPTQKLAFTLGLSRMLHCTQGPPGTGKSYVGVCLVLAFMAIREVVREKYPYIGPIVALSYKNHALDEFLVDILESNPAKFHKRGALIRLGKPESEKLERFTERRSQDESLARQNLEKYVETLKKARGLVQLWLEKTDISTDYSLSAVCHCLRIVHENGIRTVRKDESKEELDSDQASGDAKQFFEDVKHIVDNNNTVDYSLDDLLEENMIKPAIHWDPPNQSSNKSTKPQLLLQCWLNGDELPLRCNFREEENQCLNHAIDDSEYCEEHTCSFLKCNERRNRGQNYCDRHRCVSSIEGGCSEVKFIESPYCRDHCCPFCLDKEKIFGGAACEKHTCCEVDCGLVQMFSLPFCVKHGCEVCIATNSVSPLSMKCSQSSYCEQHKCKSDSCLERSLDSGSTCQKHSCQVCGAAIDNGIVCPQHCCQFIDDVDGTYCTQVRAVTQSGDASNFCKEHTCYFCVELNCALDKRTYSPNYTCSDHVQCQHTDMEGKKCFSLISYGFYCAHHNHMASESTSHCAGITKKGKPCRTLKPEDCNGRWYCNDHKAQSQNLIQPDTAEIDEKVRLSVLYDMPCPITGKSSLEAIPYPYGKQVLRCIGKDCECYCAVEVATIFWECFLHHNEGTAQENMTQMAASLCESEGELDILF